MQVHEPVRHRFDDRLRFPSLLLVWSAIRSVRTDIGFADDGVDLVDRDQCWSDEAQEPGNASNDLNGGLLDSDEAETSHFLRIQIHPLQPSMRNARAFQIVRNQKDQGADYILISQRSLAMLTHERIDEYSNQLGYKLPWPTT
jgi:hypothetical protein